MDQITGQTLRDWNFVGGRWMKAGLARANEMRAGGATDDEIRAALRVVEVEAAPERSST